MVHSVLTCRRNFIWEEKYKNKDPEKYQSLEGGIVAPRSQEPAEDEASMEDFSSRFSRGMSKLMSFGQSEEGSGSSWFGGGSSEMPKIQLTRRYGSPRMSCEMLLTQIVAANGLPDMTLSTPSRMPMLMQLEMRSISSILRIRYEHHSIVRELP